MNEGVVFGFFGLCFFLWFNHRRCLNMSESHGKYLVERKTLQVQKTELLLSFFILLLLLFLMEEDIQSLRG